MTYSSNTTEVIQAERMYFIVVFPTKCILNVKKNTSLLSFVLIKTGFLSLQKTT